MKTLILGVKGLLGHSLCKTFPDAIMWDKEELDITNENQVFKKIINLKPNLVINAAAYTDVNGAEKNKELCFKVNAEAVGFIAKVCNKIGAILIHISTDYVFNGEKKDYKEDDQKDAINQYGLSKSVGEDLLIKNHDKFYLIRTAGLFGKNGKNFVSTILNLAKEKKTLEIVNDQKGNLTYTKDLAEAITHILNKPYGIYHITNAGPYSWFEFAQEIIKFKKINIKLKPIKTKESNRIAKRPKFSILINTKLKPLRPLKEALIDYLKEIK